jgi:DegV family protein with EDD domain
MVMDNIRIVTDSGCDITREDEREYNIDIMPFSVMIDDKEYWERTDLQPEEFYALAENAVSIPKTAQITVMRFEEKLLECAKNGVNHIIMPLICASGSQTFNNAVMAYNNLKEACELGDMQVHILDSKAYSLGYGYPVVEAAKRLRAGQNVTQVVAFMEDWFAALEIYIVGFDLRYMKKSGRINAAAAFLGEMMGLKPVISMIDGQTKVVKKSRGENLVVTDAVNLIADRCAPETPWQFLRTTVTDKEDMFLNAFKKRMGCPAAMISQCGCVVGANAGTKFFGVIIKGKRRR